MHDGGNRAGSVDVVGATLRFVVEGRGRPCLVIGSAVYYPRTFSQALRESLRMFFVDVRHFARSDGTVDPARVSLETYADDIERVRAQMGFDRGVVIGHSHHGNLALEYAKRHPSRVSHVVLIGSPPSGTGRISEVAPAFWDAHASEKRKAVLHERTAALAGDASEGVEARAAFVARYVAEAPRYWHDPSYDAAHLWRDVPIDMDVLQRFRGFFAGDYELSWDPGHLRAPVLSIAGRDDFAVPHVLWDDVRPRLRNLAFRLFERSGHTPQLEEPQRFDRELLDWIETCHADPRQKR